MRRSSMILFIIYKKTKKSIEYVLEGLIKATSN